MNQRRKQPIIVKEHNNATHLILDEPQYMNAFFAATMRILVSKTKEVERSKNKPLLILEGSNDIFSTGGNLKLIYEGFRGSVHDYELTDITVGKYYSLAHYIGNMKTPVVAILNGLTIGGGGMLAHCAPFRIVTEKTQFAMPETKVGSFVDGGASYFLSRMDNHIGRYLALTGATIKAEDVLFCGLGTHFVKSENIPEMMDKLSVLEDFSYDTIDKAINEFGVSMDHRPKSHIFTKDTVKIIDSCFKYNEVIEIINALERNGSSFALKAKKNILLGAPTSATISLENVRRGAHMTFLNCLKMELHVFSITRDRHDFDEGVNSVLFRRKKTPTWEPNTLDQIDFKKDILDVFYKGCLTNKSYESFWNPHDNLNSDQKPCNLYALPSQKDIISVFEMLHMDAPTTIDWFLAHLGHKYGVKQKVERVLASTIEDKRLQNNEIITAKI